jgi:hypothetical protein
VIADPGPLADITGRIEKALLADLPDALPPLLTALDQRAAHEADIAQLMEALPALVRSQRYGSVRGTDTSALGTVATGMLARVVAGLPAAIGGLSPEAAAELRPHLDAVSSTIGLLSEEARALWLDAIRHVLERADVPGLLGGRLTRTLLDAGEIETRRRAAALGRALSHGPSVIERAAFAEGFLAGSALLLIHDRAILSLVDAWLAELGPDDFTEVLPVLRRALGAYNKPERRALADRVACWIGRLPPTRSRPTSRSTSWPRRWRPYASFWEVPMPDERARRWRLLLGDGPDDGLSPSDMGMDAALGALYDNQSDGEPGSKENMVVGMGASAPRVARWLGDVRTYFPSSVVQVMQTDAIDRLGLKQLLLEPEMLAAVQPDVHLVATLASLRSLLPQKARETASTVVRTVVDEVERRIADRLRSSVRGALNRAQRTRRPRPGRHRLDPYDQGQPRLVPARPQDDHPRAARRLRAQADRASPARSCCASTSRGRWRRRSCTRRSSRACWRRSGR